MRRGPILLLIMTAIVLVGCAVFVWSSPGQALWMRAKLKYRVIPMLQVIPGSIDSDLCLREMNPQWTRLIERGYVSWYHRRFPGSRLDGAASAEFWRRVRAEIPIPAPFEIASDQDYEFQTPRTYDSPVIATTITLLVHESHHARIDALAKDVFRRQGTPAPAPPPRFVNLVVYLPTRP